MFENVNNCNNRCFQRQLLVQKPDRADPTANTLNSPNCLLQRTFKEKKHPEDSGASFTPLPLQGYQASVAAWVPWHFSSSLWKVVKNQDLNQLGKWKVLPLDWRCFHVSPWYDFITCALCSQKAVAPLPHCTRCQDHKTSPHPKAEKSSQHTDLQIEHTLPQSTMAMEEPIFLGEIQGNTIKIDHGGISISNLKITRK